jgi:uncharacterized membrane protein (UPF0127 family)
VANRFTGLIAALFFTLHPGCGPGAATGADDGDDTAVNTGLATTTVLIQTQGGTLSVNAEIADTPTTQAIGLMNRQSLAADAGMLFVFDDDNTNGFWMKNTTVSLDIIFIDSGSEIIYIAENTTPLSEELLAPATPYRTVLEVNAGYSAAHGVAVGDTVSF